MSLEACGLSYGYGPREVLTDISLAIKAGESAALLGANGSGKSTLLRLLLGYYRPQRGEVRVDGEDIRLLPAAERARRLAYVPQDHGATFPYSVLDMVAMGRLPYGSWLRAVRRETHEEATACLERLGISHLATRRYTEISGGQRQLVLIARALAQGARTLILDEPVNGLDYGNQYRLLEQIQELAASGYAVFQSTHHPEHALRAANRVFLLQNGRILASGTPEETLTPRHLHRLYAVHTDLIRLHDGRQTLVPHHRTLSQPTTQIQLPTIGENP